MDQEERQENGTKVIVTEFLKSSFYSAVIQFMNYSLKLPAIFSVLPVMVLILLIMLFTRYWNNKRRQYAFLLPYVAWYFFFCLYFYNRGKLMFLTASCMTAVLAVWGVICVECFTKNVRRNVTGILVLAVVSASAYLAIWSHYSNLAEAAIKQVAQTEIGAQDFYASDVDDLCRELDVVFYAKKKAVFWLRVLEHSAIYDGEPYATTYRELQNTFSQVQDHWIGTLTGEVGRISEELSQKQTTN